MPIERPERTRRRYIVAVGSIGFGVLAGCSGDGGSNGNGGDDGTDDGNGGTDGGDGGTGSVNIPGLESVTVAGGNITVRRAEDSEVDGVRLYGPDNEQMGRGTSFNNVQREINYSISSRSQLSSSGNYGSWPSGTYTLEAVGEGGSQIGTAPLTLEREFEVVGASIGSRTGDGTFVVFEIENTGDLPVNFDRVRVLESSEVEGYRALDGSSEDEDVVMSEGYRGSAVKPGRTGTVRGRVEFTYVNRDFEEGGKEAFETPPVPPCDDWEVERTYELVGAADYGTTVEVTVRIGGEAENVRRIAYKCGEVELLEFSPGSGG